MNSEKSLKDKKKKQGNFLYDFVKVTGALPVLIWMRPRVVHYGEGRARRLRGAALIAANHLSFTDPVLIHCAFPTRRLNCLATKELYRNKLLSFFFRKMHCIQVDKDNFSMKSFHEVTERLSEGKAVVIFPEGQVNHDESAVMTYKSGAVLMAHKAGAPIVPVYMKKATHKLERRVAVIGDPIDIKTLVGERPTMKELNAASAYLRERELEMKAYCEERFGKKKIK